MLHGGAVGTETEEEVLLQWAADLICTFQVWRRKVDKGLRLAGGLYTDKTISQWLV